LGNVVVGKRFGISYFTFRRSIINQSKRTILVQLEHCIKDRRPKQRAPIGLKKKGTFGFEK